jgi:amidase
VEGRAVTESRQTGAINRRDFLRQGTLAAGAALGGAALIQGAAAASEHAKGAPAWAKSRGGDEVGEGPADHPPKWGGTGDRAVSWHQPAPDPIREASIDDLQRLMEHGDFTSRELTRLYLERIESTNIAGPRLHAVLESNPDALEIAAALDAERKSRGPRGPLHGIPILLKDNIETGDRMQSTAGSLALLGTRPIRDAFVAERLRAAGAVLLGKTNLSEWANIRSSRSVSGWSARGGQCRNPYILSHNPCGSSSGSAVAVSSDLCVVALATETDGSIVCPAHTNGVVGVKPTVGLTSRAGVVPISHTQDTIGPHARTVRDAAILLGAMTGIDPRDAATATSAGQASPDYRRFLDPRGLRGARIGVPRKSFFGYSPPTDQAIEGALEVLRREGAILVDPADIPTIDEINSSPDEMTVLLYELKADLAAYCSLRIPDPARRDCPVVRTLADAIAFNEAHRKDEMPFFGQELFLQAQEKGPLTDAVYLEAVAAGRRRGGAEGIDAILDRFQLDALVAPTGGPAWPTDPLNGDHFLGASSSPAAIAGYPLVTVPAGICLGLPVGLTFMGRAWSEPVLLRLAYAYEQTSRERRAPRFLAAMAID